MARVQVGGNWLVRLYHDWLSSSHGDAFQYIVTQLRGRCMPETVIQPAVKFTEEIRSLLVAAGRDRTSVTIPATMLKLVEIASCAVLRGPQRHAFVKLALAITAMELETLGSCHQHADAGEAVDFDLLPLEKVLQPGIVKLLHTMQQQVGEPMSAEVRERRLRYVQQALYPLPFGDFEVEFGSVLDVTKPVCQLVLTWLDRRQDVLKLMEETMDNQLVNTKKDEPLPLVHSLGHRMSKLLCVFLLNAELATSAHRDFSIKRMIAGMIAMASGCKILGKCRSFGTGAVDLTATVEEVCKEAAAAAAPPTAPLATAWLSNKSLMYKMCDLRRRTRLVAVRSAMPQLRRLYNSWIDIPCRALITDQQRRALEEQAPVREWEQDKERWESACPYRPDAARSFANFVSAVRNVEAGGREPSGDCSLTLMEMYVIHLCAIAGEYECLRPAYPGTPDPSDKSLSWVIMKMVEDKFVSATRCGQHFVGSSFDLLKPGVQDLLPVASRNALEQRLPGSNLVACRDITMHACNVLETCKGIDVGARFANRESLVAMLDAYRWGGDGSSSVQASISACLDWEDSLGMFTDGVEVGAVVVGAAKRVRDQSMQDVRGSHTDMDSKHKDSCEDGTVGAKRLRFFRVSDSRELQNQIKDDYVLKTQA